MYHDWFVGGALLLLYGSLVYTFLPKRHVNNNTSGKQKGISRLYAFHRKYLILSCYMLTTCFFRLYAQPVLDNARVPNTICQKGTRHDITTERQHKIENDTLLTFTDEKYDPIVPRTPLQNKILLSAPTAYQAPRKRNKNVHFDSDSFDICVDTGASST